MRRFLFLATYLFALAVFAPYFVSAQDASDTASDEAQTEAPADADGEAEEQAEAEILPASAIVQLIRGRKLDEAAEALDRAVAEKPEDANLQNLRELLATSYLSARKYDDSLKQLQALFDYRIANMEDPLNQTRISTTVGLLQMAASRTGETELGDSALDRAIDAIDQHDLGAVTIQAAASLVPRKAMHLAARGDVAGANEMLLSRIERIDSLDASGTMKEALVSAKCKLLTAAATLPGAAEDANADLEDYIDQAVKEFPKSSMILLEYGRIQAMFISKTYRDDPKGAQQRLTQTLSILEPAAVENRDLRLYVSRLKSLETRIESALKLAEMVGQPAPELQVAAWVNQGDLSEDSLQGKVVLLDFWSVWCGPCIATFPHLREWHDEFQKQGFEIVGVTRHYNYTWDDEADRATRSKEPVAPEDEQEMLGKFMEHHNLRHPTIVTPKDSTMQKEYGVTGIPHAVLIDRKGIVRMIKVGSGPLNAEALHEKIQELISE